MVPLTGILVLSLGVLVSLVAVVGIVYWYWKTSAQHQCHTATAALGICVVSLWFFCASRDYYGHYRYSVGSLLGLLFVHSMASCHRDQASRYGLLGFPTVLTLSIALVMGMALVDTGNFWMGGGLNRYGPISVVRYQWIDSSAVFSLQFELKNGGQCQVEVELECEYEENDDAYFGYYLVVLESDSKEQKRRLNCETGVEVWSRNDGASFQSGDLEEYFFSNSSVCEADWFSYENLEYYGRRVYKQWGLGYAGLVSAMVALVVARWFPFQESDEAVDLAAGFLPHGHGAIL